MNLNIGDIGDVAELLAFQEAGVVCYEQLGAYVDTGPVTGFGEDVASRSSTPVDLTPVGQEPPVNEYDEVVYFARVFSEFW
jgi:hypothetical protein